MKTYLCKYQSATAVVSETSPAYNEGYNFGKPLYYLTPEENLEPADEGAKIEILAELPDMDTWQIKAVNDVLKQLK